MIQLIRSLSQSEKRYFKLNLIHHSEDQKVIKLFDYIDRNKNDSETQIKAKLPPGYDKYYSVYKNTLQEKILISLRAFHQKNNPRYEVNNLFTEIDILYNKRLIELCRKKIRRLRNLIEENQLDSEIPKLINVENLPGIEEGFLDSKEIIEIEKRQVLALNKINEAMTFWLLPHKFVALRNAYRTTRSSEDKSSLDSFCLDQQKFSIDKDKLQVMSRVNLLNTQSLVLEYQGSNDLAWKKRREVGDLFLKHPKIIRSNPSRFIDMFYNYTISCLKTENFTEGLEACDRLESSASTYGFKLTNHLQSRVFEYSALMRLLLLIKSNNYESYNLIEQIQNGYPNHKKHLRPNTQLALIYFISYHYFVNKNFNESLNWINKIGGIKKHDDPEILTAANLFKIILHIEMDDRDYLENYFRSSLYFIKKKSRTLFIEKTVIELAKLFVKFKLDNAALSSALHKFEKLELSPMDQSILYSFDLRAWIRSKINAQSFKEELKRRSKS